MDGPIISFSWKSLESHFPGISEEKKKRLEEIILNSAHEFYPKAYVPANGVPLDPAQRKIGVFFFRGRAGGMHVVFPDDREYIGLNISLLMSEGHLACRSYHELSHSYDSATGLLPPYSYKNILPYVQTDIRAFSGELDYLKRLPQVVWSSEEERKLLESEISGRLEEYHAKILKVESVQPFLDMPFLPQERI